MNESENNIIAVAKDEKGEITAYKLGNDEIVMKKEAVDRVRNGKISGVMVGVSKNGEEYLKGMPDGNMSNNLDSLPTFNISQ